MDDMDIEEYYDGILYDSEEPSIEVRDLIISIRTKNLMLMTVFEEYYPELLEDREDFKQLDGNKNSVETGQHGCIVEVTKTALSRSVERFHRQLSRLTATWLSTSMSTFGTINKGKSHCNFQCKSRVISTKKILIVRLNLVSMVMVK